MLWTSWTFRTYFMILLDRISFLMTKVLIPSDAHSPWFHKILCVCMELNSHAETFVEGFLICSIKCRRFFSTWIDLSCHESRASFHPSESSICSWISNEHERKNICTSLFLTMCSELNVDGLSYNPKRYFFRLSPNFTINACHVCMLTSDCPSFMQS